jgi:hypothetical protein
MRTEQFRATGPEAEQLGQGHIETTHLIVLSPQQPSEPLSSPRSKFSARGGTVPYDQQDSAGERFGCTTVSPPIADMMRGSLTLRRLVLLGLNPLVDRVRLNTLTKKANPGTANLHRGW